MAIPGYNDRQVTYPPRPFKIAKTTGGILFPGESILNSPFGNNGGWAINFG